MSKRRLARENCLQSLYVADIGAYGPDSVLASFQMSDFALDEKTFGFYRELFSATISNLERIDFIIRSASANWDLARMSSADRSILRMAVCEMMVLADAPAPVVIDEAIELAKKYSTENSGKFVNGVLDSVAKNNNLLKGAHTPPEKPRTAAALSAAGAVKARRRKPRTRAAGPKAGSGPENSPAK